MNKYQEALETLEYLAAQYENTKTGEQWDEITDEIQTNKKIMQELVDKATPKKLINDIVSDSYDEDGLPESFEYEVMKCPNCRAHLVDESEDIDFRELPYCPYRGKALDWSEEDGSSD